MTDRFDDEAENLLRRGFLSGGDLQEAGPVPTALGPYRLQRLLGRGGLGDVYLARDSSSGREVALKILRSSAPKHLERFVREAGLARRLSHPNIATVFDSGQLEGWHFIAQQYIDGVPVSEGRFSVGEAVEKIRLAALAVQYAHEQGILHRDLTPGNLLVDTAGTPFVVDFGLAKPMEEETEALSMTGSVLGSPFYMSPEQAQGRVHELDARTDVYGLGATLYAMVTGSPPFPEETLYSTIKRVVEQEPSPPSQIEPAVPKELEWVILKAMEKDRGRRYATAMNFAEDLKRFLDGSGVQARPPGIGVRAWRAVRRRRAVVLAAGVLVFAAVAAPLWWRERRAAEDRLESQRELNGLWSEIVIARQGLYQAQKDPGRTYRRIEEILEQVGEYVRRHPSESQGYYVRARGELYLDEPERARETLQTAVAFQKEFAPGWMLLGRVNVELFERIALRAALRPKDAEDGVALLQNAAEAFRRGSAEERSDSLRKWGLGKIEEDETAEKLAHALSWKYEKKDEKKARETLEEAHRSSPSEEYCYWLGLWEKETARRLEYLSEVLKVMPHHLRAFHARAWIRSGSGDFSGAVEDMDRAVAMRPDSAGAILDRAFLRGLSGDVEGSMEDYDRGLSLDPKRVDAYVSRAFVKASRGDREGTMRDFESAIRLKPDSFDVYTNRASAKVMLGDLKGAVEDYTEVLRRDPGNVSARLGRGVIRFRSGEFPGAVDDCSEVLRLDAGSTDALVVRAWAQERLAEGAEAESLLRRTAADFEKANELLAGEDSPNAEAAKEGLARVRERLKRFAQR